MKKFLCTIVVLLVGIVEMSAQYYRINYDAKTIAAMTGAYGTETASEAYYNEQIKEILKHYRSAEVAAATIYSSKYMDRKALTDLGLWASAEENYYYRRIYNMVSAKIMPKIWDLSGLMLKRPQNAFYNGTYLFKACEDTKNLCMQFESVVTNSRLSFRNIAFLEMCPEAKAIFDLAQMGNMNWNSVLNSFGNISGNFTKENLKSDLETLYSDGINLISNGGSNLGSQLMGKSSFDDLVNGKASAIAEVAKNSYGIFNNAYNNLGGTLISLAGKDNVSNLFNVSNYNLSSWISDYDQESIDRYYTQRWYIYRRDAGSETLCNYVPPTGKDDIISGSHWTRFNTTDENFYPNASQTEQALVNSENHARWSRKKVEQLNNSNDGFYYSMNYWRSSYIITTNGSQSKKAYAYSITVTKSWNNTEEVYEDYFDSYSMDLNTFKAQLQARLDELNDNEQGYTYYIGYDSKNYYQATDANKLKGCEMVIISVTCHDNVSLGEGITQYKCRSCGGSVNAHTQECAMQTTLSNDNLDLSELYAKETEARNNIASIQSQIDNLEAENARLVKLMANCSYADLGRYRMMYNDNKAQIDALQKDLATWKAKLDEIEQAKAEAAQDNATATDDYYRIPAIMNDCRIAYNLTWKGDGWWDGNTYCRKASMPNINGEITFKATVSVARKPKYFLGIKIHRAIVQIAWSLTGEYSDTQVVDMVELNPDDNESNKTAIVNRHISDVAKQYPNCQVSTEYIRTEPQATDDTEDTYHLLWSSDRLEIAREIDARITKIYADLVSLEKFMYYRISIMDLLRKEGFQLDKDQGRRLNLLEICHERWMENARNPQEKSKKGEEDDSDNRLPQGGMIEENPIEFKSEEDAEP